MNAGELCTRTVVFALAGESVYNAARTMRRFDVGDVVVVEENNGLRKPIGLVTDRDITIQVVAQGLDPRILDVDEIMLHEVITVDEETPVEEVVETMKTHGVRRMPVVNRQGGLEGILALDDVVDLLAEELGAVAELITRQQRRQKEKLLAESPEDERFHPRRP